MQSKSEKVFEISVDFTLQWETSRSFPQKRWQIWAKKKKVKVNQSSRRKCATATGKISFPLRRMLAMQPFPWPARAPALREISSDHHDEHGGDDHDREDDEDNDDNWWHCHPSHDPCLREAPSSDAISLGLLYPGYNFSYPPIPTGHSGFLPLLLRKWASTLLLLFWRTDFKPVRSSDLSMSSWLLAIW